MLKILAKHIDGNLMRYDGFEWRTPRHLLNMGIGCCSQCGSLLTERQHNGWYCTQCCEVVLIVADDVEEQPFNNELALLQQHNRRYAEKMRQRRIIELQLAQIMVAEQPQQKRTEKQPYTLKGICRMCNSRCRTGRTLCKSCSKFS